GIRDFHVTGVQTCALPIFYARLVVTEQGRFNLQQIATPANAAEGDGATERTPSDESVRIAIGETRVTQGRIDFSDRFIQPNYSRSEERRGGDTWRAVERHR